ncbi:MAG: hypothetical protein ACLQNE_15575, partial [Thermoguttaceae bacterium]
NVMVCLRRHFVPNPVQVNYCTRRLAKRRRPQLIHTGYDERGNKTGASYFGTDGKPCRNVNGIAAWKATFDERARQTSLSFFGLQGEPIIAPKLGYQRIVTKYDGNGQVLEHKYFDCKDNPLSYAETVWTAYKKSAEK